MTPTVYITSSPSFSCAGLVFFLSSKAIVVSEIFYVFWWRNSNKYPYKQWYSLQITTIPPLCTSDVSKENNKCLWEQPLIFWPLDSRRQRLKEEIHRFMNHFSPHILHPCPKGTLSLVYWQLCIALSTLENSHKLVDKTYNKNYFKYFKYDRNVQYIRQVYIFNK